MQDMPRTSYDFTVRVAKNVGKAYQLIEVGFEHSTGEYRDSGKIFRKRKQRISKGSEKTTY